MALQGTQSGVLHLPSGATVNPTNVTIDMVGSAFYRLVDRRIEELWDWNSLGVMVALGVAQVT